MASVAAATNSTAGAQSAAAPKTKQEGVPNSRRTKPQVPVGSPDAKAMPRNDKTGGGSGEAHTKRPQQQQQQQQQQQPQLQDQEGDDSSRRTREGGLRRQLKKTKFCVYHFRGACQFGAECAFAHSSQELEDTPDLRKTRICKAFAEGGCRDPTCSFAHGDKELRNTDVFFKKTLCVWNERGKCRNGDGCRFAHGMQDLCSTQEIAPSALTRRNQIRKELKDSLKEPRKEQASGFAQKSKSQGNAPPAQHQPSEQQMQRLQQLKQQAQQQQLQQQQLAATLAGLLPEVMQTQFSPMHSSMQDQSAMYLSPTMPPMQAPGLNGVSGLGAFTPMQSFSRQPTGESFSRQPTGDFSRQTTPEEEPMFIPCHGGSPIPSQQQLPSMEQLQSMQQQSMQQQQLFQPANSQPPSMGSMPDVAAAAAMNVAQRLRMLQLVQAAESAPADSGQNVKSEFADLRNHIQALTAQCTKMELQFRSQQLQQRVPDAYGPSSSKAFDKLSFGVPPQQQQQGLLNHYSVAEIETLLQGQMPQSLMPQMLMPQY